MEEALKRFAELVAVEERRLGLDSRSSYSRVTPSGPDAVEIELSREEVLRAVAGEIGLPMSSGLAVEADSAIDVGGLSVRFRLLGAEGKRLLWAISSVADVRREAAHSSELLTQLIMGEIARPLKAQGDWYLVRLADDYHGWIRSWYVRETAGSETETFAAATNAVVVANVGYAYSEPDERSVPVADVVAGVRLVVGEETQGFRRVSLPGGKTGFMRGGDLAPPPAGPPDRLRLVERARRFLGIPYLWGGASAKGFDCSGLVKRVYDMEGVALPRDSNQQALVGALIARGDADRAAPGDLLFFGEGGAVSHVAIHIGNGMFIHAHGEVRLTSLVPGNERYEKKFADIFLHGRSIIS